jgi:hypothetical protein
VQRIWTRIVGIAALILALLLLSRTQVDFVYQGF